LLTTIPDKIFFYIGLSEENIAPWKKQKNVTFQGGHQFHSVCVSRIVAFIVKNIDAIIFLHVLLVNIILHM